MNKSNNNNKDSKKNKINNEVVSDKLFVVTEIFEEELKKNKSYYYLQEHVFRDENDEDSFLEIRPIRILLDNYRNSVWGITEDLSGYVKNNRTEIIQIIMMLEEKDIAQSFRDLVLLMADKEAIEYIDRIDTINNKLFIK